MPTLADLKTELERVLGDEHLKAETYARPLRTAGLITTGGRGSSAPQMTARDAAHLFIAILGHAPAAKGPETVEQYRSLPLLRRPPGPRGYRSPQPQKTRNLETLPLRQIRSVHFFGEVVELLIRRAADGKIERLASRWTGGPENPGLSLRLIGPEPAAILRAPMLGKEMKRPLVYASEDQSSSATPVGIERASEIHEDVLIAIGRLF